VKPKRSETFNNASLLLITSHLLLFPRLPMPTHKPFHAMQGFFDLAVLGGRGRAEKTSLLGPKALPDTTAALSSFGSASAKVSSSMPEARMLGKAQNAPRSLKVERPSLLRPFTSNRQRWCIRIFVNDAFDQKKSFRASQLNPQKTDG
jgi:hypothetical protein